MSPDVQVALITTVGAVLASVIGALWHDGKKNRRVLNSLREDVSITRYEVKNDHGTNMREDIDRLGDKLDVVLKGQDRHDEMLATHGGRLASMQDDARLERQERINLGNRVDDVHGDVRALGERLDKHLRVNDAN